MNLVMQANNSRIAVPGDIIVAPDKLMLRLWD